MAAASVEAQQKLLDDIASGRRTGPVPPEAMQIILDIAETGAYVHSWESLRPLLTWRMTNVLDESNSKVADCPDRPHETFKDKKQQLVDALNSFENAPFTFQRLCELLAEPFRQYKSTNKLASGFDRVLSVSSSYPPCDPKERALAAEPQEEVGAAAGAGAGAAAAPAGIASETMDAPMADGSSAAADDAGARAGSKEDS